MHRLPRPMVLCALLLLFLAQLGFAQKKEPEVTLNVGDEAPPFTLKDDLGNDWIAADHYGKKIIVVYFYPADMTPGCTKQACGFRDHLEELQAEDVEVVGISGDSVRNHQLFKKAHSLNFALLADVDGEAAMKFGVPYFAGEHTVNAVIDGKEESLVRDITTHRWTFVIGKDKKIKLKNEQVQAAQDSENILNVVNQLQN
ncbi:MAG: peroxiredoxin [Planctomycetaceae bacterium]